VQGRERSRFDPAEAGTTCELAQQRGEIVKVRPSVKRRCEKCKIIKRRGVVRVICENPKHKQRQG